LLKERTQTINTKIKLHILGVPMNKLGNWLIGCSVARGLGAGRLTSHDHIF